MIEFDNLNMSRFEDEKSDWNLQINKSPN